MRREVSPWIFAVDASNKGAGVVIGDRLTKEGRQAASTILTAASLANPMAIISIESFAGLGGGGLACDLLGINVLLRVAIECDTDVIRLIVQDHASVCQDL